MSVATKRRVILKNLMHINSSVDTKQRASTGVLVQVTADVWPVTPRPRTRGTGAALPFQKRVQRAIGHISGIKSRCNTPVSRGRSHVTTATVHTFEEEPSSGMPSRITLRYRRSSTAHNGAFSGAADMINFNGGDNTRKSSSETRTSSSPDDTTVNTRDRHRPNRPNSRGKRRTPHINGLIPLERVTRDMETELPSVLDENITGTKLSLPTQRIKPQAKPSSRSVALKPLGCNDHITNSLNNATHTQKQMKSLSISGLTKPESATNEDNTSAPSWSHNPQSSSIIKPSTVSSHSQQNHNNNSSAPTTSSNNNNTTSSYNNNTAAATALYKTDSNNTSSGLAVTASSVGSNNNPRRTYKPNNISQSGSGNTKSLGNSRRKSPEEDSLYADPAVGASPSFQSRLSELASLEAETVRYERLRRLKKKNKEKDD